MGKLDRLLYIGVMDKYVIKYRPGMVRLKYQRFIYFVKTIRDPVDSTYKNLQTAEFKIKLTGNQYVNLNRVHLCFPIKLRRKQTKQLTLAQM